CSCPVCRASFTRRYLAYSHTREAHSKHGHIEELREEYKALLEVCFPGASNRRRRRSRAVAKATTISDISGLIRVALEKHWSLNRFVSRVVSLTWLFIVSYILFVFRYVQYW
uniref:C2H2-type domain-containing protein n=1 Tax=Angiostrongylus cantonensis TaxID=6313 RepID=A0A0K0D8F5_ANGCA